MSGGIRKISYVIGALAVLGIIAFASVRFGENFATPSAPVADFEECAAAGNPVMESYPRQCRTPDGRLFVENISIPEQPQQPISSGGGCAVGGCSGQLCVEAGEASGIVTTCEFRPEYSCYQKARCERQANNRCGWTQTQELQICLKNPPRTE